MLTLHFPWGTYHHGIGLEEDPPDWYQHEAVFNVNFLGFLMFNRGFFNVWDAWLKRYHANFPTQMTIFNGHGGHKDSQWCFCDNGTCDRTVQSLVDEYDGEALLILLLCCNPDNIGRLTSQKSLVIYQRASLSPDEMLQRKNQQWMHIPGYGDFIGTRHKKRLLEIAAEIMQPPVAA